MQRFKLRQVFSGIAAVVVATACSSVDSLSPFQPEVMNAANNFQAQATGVTSASLVRSYTWQNSGARATVNHSTTTTAGTAKLLIRDAAGTVVYDKGLAASLNEPTSSGVSGAWRIELTLTNYSGTMNFRVQKL